MRCPQNLPIWNAFSQQGWVEAGQFTQHAFGVTLPNTCKAATRHDTLLLPPVLQQFVYSADVMTEAMLFDAHAPMRLRLRSPGRLPQIMHWRLPRPFADFHLECKDIAQQYHAANHLRASYNSTTADQGPVALQTWSAAVEEAASMALCKKAAQLKWPQGLPKAYTGRCSSRHRAARILPQLPKNGRQGQPQPSTEATSVRSRHKLRQRRRIHVLGQGISKLRNTAQGPMFTTLLRSLLQQWSATQKAVGYDGGFPA